LVTLTLIDDNVKYIVKEKKKNGMKQAKDGMKQRIDNQQEVLD